MEQREWAVSSERTLGRTLCTARVPESVSHADMHTCARTLKDQCRNACEKQYFHSHTICAARAPASYVRVGRVRSTSARLRTNHAQMCIATIYTLRPKEDKCMLSASGVKVPHR